MNPDDANPDDLGYGSSEFSRTPATPPDREVERRKLLDLVVRLLDRDPYGRYVRRRVLEGALYREIAEEEGTSVQTARERTAAALRRTRVSAVAEVMPTYAEWIRDWPRDPYREFPVELRALLADLEF